MIKHNGWTQEEDSLILDGLRDGKAPSEIATEFRQKFSSRRSKLAIKTRYYSWKNKPELMNRRSGRNMSSQSGLLSHREKMFTRIESFGKMVKEELDRIKSEL